MKVLYKHDRRTGDGQGRCVWASSWSIWLVSEVIHIALHSALRGEVKDDKTEENTFEILQHSDININNS